MGRNSAYKIAAPKSSVRNNLLIAIFLVLAFSGIIINIIFINVIHAHLLDAGIDNDVIRSVSRHFTIIGSGVTIVGILIVLCIALFLSGSIMRPIKKLTDGMLDIASGKWNTRIDISTNDEFGQLSDGFNFMVEQIEDTMQKLKAAKEYTDNIVISVPSVLIVLSNRFNILSTNMAYEKLNEQYPTLSLNQLINPLESEIKKNLETGETTKKEIVIVPEDSEVSLIFSAIVSRIGNNGVECDEEQASILLTITDITERKKMKELVLQSKQDWEDTFNSIPDIITIHDKDYNIIHANKAATDILHLPVMDTIQSNKCYKYYHGTDKAPEGCPSCDCLNTKLPATFEIFEPHLNKYIEIRSIPRINNQNKLIGLIHVARDISLRKKIEGEHNQLLVAITKAKIEWEMTFDSVKEFIILIDKELRITRCNKSFAEFVGKQVDNIVGHNCYDFFPCPQAQVEDCINHMINSRDLSGTSELETETGRWLYISHRPIQDDKEKLLKSVIIATDVTELKIAQQKVRESEKELKKKVDDLEKFYDMAVGRELKMKELKKEIRRLNQQFGEHEEINSVK